MKKKLLTVAAVLMFAAVAVLGGCGGNSGDSGEKQTDETSVQSFRLITPENGENGVDVQPTLEWSSSKYALKYSLYISGTADFAEGDVVYTKNNIASPYHTVSDFSLDYGTVYYWKVESIGKGEGNKLWASNSPLSFTTANDTTVTLHVSNLSYISGSDMNFTYGVPSAAVNPTVEIAASEDFADGTVVYSHAVSDGTGSVPKTKIGNGKFYVKLSAEIDGKNYSSEIQKIFIGENILIHDFTTATTDGYNAGVRNWSGGTQLGYEIADGKLKVTYDVGSYADYIIIDFSTDKDILSKIKASAYLFVRYKADEYVGGVLLKMRGDDTVTSNWKDYTIGDISGTGEWREALIQIDTSSVINLNRLPIAIMTSISGAIYFDDIYLIKAV